MVITVPDEVADVLQQLAVERGISAEQVAVAELARLTRGLPVAARSRVMASIERHRVILDRLAAT